MGIACGSQVVLCEYPVRFDTYSGCSHDCKYCFARGKTDISQINVKGTSAALRNFIEGKKTVETAWLDWKIPLHWGGLSDPFQPDEEKYKVSLSCLKLLAETQYPVIISTKGKLLAEEPYLSLLQDCNAVVQISMLCSSYDKMEQGAPTFEERLKMLEKISSKVKRTIVRAQPYIVEVRDELISNLPKMKEAGAYGITIEGMKFKKAKPGLVKYGGDICYPESRLKSDYILIRKAAKDVGLAFFCAENRLRPMGDSYACCGCGDIEGFEGNRFNAVSLINGLDVKPTELMCQENTGGCFKTFDQSAGSSLKINEKPFARHMLEVAEKMRNEW